MRHLLLMIGLLLAMLLVNCQKDNQRAEAVQPNTTEGLKETSVRGTTENSPEVKGFGVDFVDPEMQDKISNMKPKAHNENPNIEITGVNMNAPVSPVMVMNGKKVWDDGKCGSCHALDQSASSATALQDVLARRGAAFIVNMMYYPDPQKTVTGADRTMIERCGHRQDGELLSVIQARDLVEFFRANENL